MVCPTVILSDMQMWSCVLVSLRHTHHKCNHLSWPSMGSCRSSTCWLGSSAAGCWTGHAGWGHPEHADTCLWNFGDTFTCQSASKYLRLLPVHPELDGDAEAGSVVAGEAGCGGRGLVHSLQELLQGSEALVLPVLMAGWREEGSPHGNPAYQKTADGGYRSNYSNLDDLLSKQLYTVAGQDVQWGMRLTWVLL